MGKEWDLSFPRFPHRVLRVIQQEPWYMSKVTSTKHLKPLQFGIRHRSQMWEIETDASDDDSALMNDQLWSRLSIAPTVNNLFFFKLEGQTTPSV